MLERSQRRPWGKVAAVAVAGLGLRLRTQCCWAADPAQAVVAAAVAAGRILGVMGVPAVRGMRPPVAGGAGREAGSGDRLPETRGHGHGNLLTLRARSAHRAMLM